MEECSTRHAQIKQSKQNTVIVIKILPTKSTHCMCQVLQGAIFRQDNIKEGTTEMKEASIVPSFVYIFV